MKTTKHFFIPSLTIFLTFLTLLFATAAQAQVPSYVPTNGLVGYWPFNGNANDASVNGNDGTVNEAALIADRFGSLNSALGKQMLKQQILSTNTTINTSSFAAGNYVVKVGGGVKKFEVVR